MLSGELLSSIVTASDVRRRLATIFKGLLQNRLTNQGQISRTAYIDMESNNKNIKVSSFKSSENIQNKECGPDRPVSLQ